MEKKNPQNGNSKKTEYSDSETFRVGSSMDCTGLIPLLLKLKQRRNPMRSCTNIKLMLTTMKRKIYHNQSAAYAISY